MLKLPPTRQLGESSLMLWVWPSILRRGGFVLALINRTWAKYVLPLWALICTYDTALSQLVPKSWEERFPKMKEVIAGGWLPWWIWVLILAVIIAAASFEYAFRTFISAQHHQTIGDGGGGNPLQIVVGSGKLFDQTRRDDQGIHHVISVAVKNRSSSMITNCRLCRKYVSCDFYYRHLFLLKESFSLQPEEQLFIPVSALNEESSSGTTHQIVLCGLIGGYVSRPPWLPPGEYMIGLEATSLETEPFEMYCRLWVDPQGQLRLDALGTSGGASYDVPIWMAIQYVAIRINEEVNQNYLPKSRAEIRQKAIDGKLTIFGKKQIQDNPFAQTWKFSDAITSIGSPYWDTHKIGPYASVTPLNVNNPYTISEARNDAAPNGWEDSYADLRVSWNEVAKLWP